MCMRECMCMAEQSYDPMLDRDLQWVDRSLPIIGA